MTEDGLIDIRLKSAVGGTSTHRVDRKATMHAFAMWAAGLHGYDLVQGFSVGIETEGDADGDRVINDLEVSVSDAIERYGAPPPYTFWVHPRGGGA